MTERKSARAIDWEAVKERLREAERLWDRPIEDDPARAAKLMERRRRQVLLRSERGAARRAETAFLIFSLGKERYGLPLEGLSGVTPFQKCAGLPAAPAALLGVMHRGGEIFSVLDLADLLGMPPAAESPPGFVLLLRRRPVVGLRVDDVVDVRRLAAEDVLRPEASDGRRLAGYTRDHAALLDLNALTDHALLREERP